MEHMAEDPDTVMADTVMADTLTAVTVTPCEDGPLLVRGPFTLMTQDGRHIDPGRATVALCRCGRSATKPFCDGSHKAAGFRATSEPDSPG
ncbi:CDGSH iron-sulfur domain-containing protein [Microbispora hainanensis]|uniref:CDGSH iron-sulfur domain-containing protein n=1 Tax=Microbispora hainanensis TaxID=568844 RepID=UPI003406854B